ncbi:ArsR/SmtB family transcription factor [Streptomyces sp. NPDC056512]|uniref:ArsR/SmtB family transcription factor n=1 Tax=Streptomyces sp. NPDC056512 TaxID=3345846 RepID=UPI0036B85433
MTTRSGGEPDVAAVAALFADRRRARMLMALAAGKPLPAGQLAQEAGISASTASSHLAILLEHELVTVTEEGRHRYYRLATPAVEKILEALATVAPQQPITSLREHGKSQAVREGRTCYGHLAGRIGVELLRDMVERDWISSAVGQLGQTATADPPSVDGEDKQYLLTERGAGVLLDAGIRSAALTMGSPLRYCVDWTEQAHHLAGSLGRAITDRLFEVGVITRGPVPRSVLHQSLQGARLIDTLKPTC